jgi:hypothetical protein
LQASRIQAFALWNWVNVLHDNVPDGKKIVRLNLDETSVKMYQDTGRGYLSQKARKMKKQGPTLHRKVPRTALRTTFTHVGVVCDDPEVQKLVPQVLIMNNRALTAAAYHRILSTLPPHIKLWRMKTAWMNISTACKVIRLIGEALKGLAATTHFILGLDACSIHINAKVWNQAAKYNILMFCIPAKVTWLLQPCDVYVFSQYKWKLRCAAHAMASSSRVVEVSLENTVAAVVKAIEAIFLGQSWYRAFDRLGLCGNQLNVSKRVLDELGLQSIPNLTPTMPSLADLRACFPMRRDIPIEAVFRGLSRLVVGDLGAPVPPDPGLASAPRDVWHVRTRSTSSLVTEAVAPVAAASAAPAGSLSRVPTWRPLLRLHRLPSKSVLPPLPPPP